MRILITGATGLLGKNLLDIVDYNEFEVVLFIRNIEKLSNFMKNDFLKRVTIVKGDIRDFNDCTKNIKDVDLVIHLAASIGGTRSIKNPRDYCITNSFGTLNVLEAMRLNDINRIIFSSSIAVYGNNVDVPENDITKICPLTPYDFSKFLSEKIYEMYSRVYGIQYIILRFSYLYGRYQSESNLISDLIRKIKSNNVIEIGNDVSRDFLNARDAARTIIEFIKFKNNKSDIFNVGTGKETKVSEVIMLLSKIMNRRIEVRIGATPTRDAKLERWREKANIEKIRKLIGWEPIIPLEKGLEEVVEWYHTSTQK